MLAQQFPALNASAATTVWWHLYPLGFLGAEKSAIDVAVPRHRLSALSPWIDYAADMGASGLQFGPMFASEHHGYDTTDHFRIDPRLGDDGDFDHMVRACHGRGLKVMLDGVFNHVGQSFDAFQAVLGEGPGSASARWFKLHWPADAVAGTEPKHHCFEGHSQLVTLNHDDDAVVRHVTDVMLHWLERGIDGWRLDAAYAVPTAFWQKVLPEVRRRFPQAYIVGEVIHGAYDEIVRATGFDSVTQYELWKAIWSSLNDRNLFELKHALERNNHWLDSFVPMTFVGNHDVTRLATKLADTRHVAIAVALLLLLPGTPAIYAGDEQGFQGLKEARPGGDDAIRPAFPNGPTELLPYGWPLYRLHRDLIELRRARPWLATSKVRIQKLSTSLMLLELGSSADALHLAINVSEVPTQIGIPAKSRVLIETGAIHHGPDQLLLEGGSFAALELRAPW